MEQQTSPYYDFNKVARDLEQGQISMSSEPGKWELDIQPYLDRLYHELLGETPDTNTGTWTLDKAKSRVMNELGASEFVQEISARISIHQQLSELDDVDILDIATRCAEDYADKIEDNYIKWEIIPAESNFKSIAGRLYDALFIALRIARRGAMKLHRERSKNPYIQYRQPAEQGGLL